MGNVLLRAHRAIAVAVVLACLASGAWAEKIGPEFRVNSPATSADWPAVAALADGSFVVTWHGQDGDGSGIYAQRYRADGTTLGSGFKVNTYTPGDQRWPSISGVAGGGFVIVWASEGQDGDGWGVCGQRFGANGNPRGGEFRVNSYTAYSQYGVSVAALPNGGFVVAWQSFFQDGDGSGIYGQIYAANGTPRGGEFRVNTTTAHFQDGPSIAAFADGDFVIVWQSFGVDPKWGDPYGLGYFGQRYNAHGKRRGEEFQIAAPEVIQNFVSVAALADDGFVVVWSSDYGFGDRVYARHYRANGIAWGEPFKVNTYMGGSARAGIMSVAGLSDGKFVIVWQSWRQDGSDWGIYGQRFGAHGTARGHEFRINTYKMGSQTRPYIAALADGQFVVVWLSPGQGGSPTGIYGQRFSR